VPEFGLMAVDWEERIDFGRMRAYRLERAKQALSDSGADVLFIIRTEDIRYVTGFRHHLGPVTRFGSDVCVLPRGGEPILYTMDYEHARARMPWMPRTNIRPAPNWRELLGLSAWAADVQGLTGDLAGKAIGIDQVTISLLDRLRETFPKSQIVDGWPILSEAKKIKCEDEIECLKAANMITEAGMEAALRILRPGVRECEVLAEAWRTFTAMGSEWSQCANIITSGPSTAPYRRFTSDRIIRMGDVVIIDIGAGYNGYWGDLTRSWICGDIDATPEQRDLHQHAYDSLFKASAEAKPGNTNADVYRAAEPYVMGPVGHGAGVNPWEPPYFTADSKDNPQRLEIGMVMNIEPYAGKPGVGGFRLENDLVVRVDGPEIYTTFPFDERLVSNVHALDRTTGRSHRGSMIGR
jgi:Xaa-Pro aminopeptidase